MRDYFERVFAVDLRSLAVMRIAVAISVLVDLATRMMHLGEHYTDAGMLPRDAAASIDALSNVSLLAISGSQVWATVVFVLAIGLALAMLVGWRTRIATVALWLVVLSIQHRNPILLDHRDVLFASALLLGALLPWGEAFSIDARGRPRATHRYTGAPAAAYVLAIAFVYLFSALLKTGPEWRSELTAVEHAIGIEYWASSRASWLREHGELTSMLTVAVLAFEALVAPLLLTPWRISRWLVVLGIVALQLGFFVFLWLDTFPLIAAAISLGLLPWSAAEPRGETSRWRTGIAGTLIAIMLALNMMSFDRESADSEIRRPAQLLGIDQNWSMFAPSPSRLDGWFVVAARFADDTELDLMTGRAPTFARPASFRTGISTTRELVYLRRLLAYEDARRPFLVSHCRRAGAATITLYFIAVRAGQLEAPEALAALDC